MNLSNIKQSLEKIDYAWNKPHTYLVLIPGLSLYIEKIQLAITVPLVESYTQEERDVLIDIHSRKFDNITKWHLRGSLIQILASVAAIKILSHPLFRQIALVAGCLAFCEVLYTSFYRFKIPVTLYEFYPNGQVKSISSTRAPNIF